MPLHRLVLLGVALFAAGPVLADDKPKPNTLTPKEIADGWLLLFDGETTFGWKTEGNVSVRDGEMVVAGPKRTSIAKFEHLPWNFEMAFDLKAETMGVSVGGDGLSHAAPEWTTFRVRYTHTGKQRTSDWVILAKNGQAKELMRSAGDSSPGTSPDVRIVSTDKPTHVRNVKLRPLDMKPLFNGKDLTGWKVFQDSKRSKTKFEVTKGGELSAKNGPGDLQTEKQFDNFVLQLECKTNGKWLNSGIFFRCLPDQYQQGYEAQIQNGYIGTDRTKPVDYGTGAIYRRVPARKVVSNDNEWFTMTVVADGAHMATWVNGYQTVDWTDDRKPADNARQGLKTGKGHLSIQGHDPTTDLLFRNIRIAELAGKRE